MKIADFDLDRKVLVVAEIGNNHEGSYELAEKLIGLAAKAGADAVKFQTIVPDKLVAPDQKERIRQLNRFQFNHKQIRGLKKAADREKVIFLSTPFSIGAVAMLNDLVPAFKISSGDNNFLPLIAAVADTGKPILLSSGMAEMDEIEKTISFIRDRWGKSRIDDSRLAVLHCVVSYPTPPEEADLLAIRALQSLGVTVGYSDHTLGIEAAVLSIALGARIVEKHFTINKHYSDFRDHQLSADPEDMKELVRRIKEATVFLGDGKKRVLECEKENIERVRRSIVANCPLHPGDIIDFGHLNWVRMGHGLPPGSEDVLIGRRVKQFIGEGQAILPSSVE
jgi:N-acetylneuraminate synthase/N,N'-diacetyllegionaminate synthase